MEVTVLETGDLPASTIISFHTGSIRRHAQIEKNKAINLSYVSGSEPVRVDLMSQVGSHTFDMIPGQDVYEVPIRSIEAGGEEVKLKFQIREASASTSDFQEAKGSGKPGDENGFMSPASPSRKLQTALMMRSYLDNHDVLRQMQELLQDMVTHRPEDPVEYMINRLEEVCRDSQGVDVDLVDGAIVKDGAKEGSVDLDLDHVRKKMSAALEGALDNGSLEKLLSCQAKTRPVRLEDIKDKAEERAADSDEDEDDDDGPDEMPMPPPTRGRKCSVSEEAYGAFNQRRAYEPKIIPKDAGQKARVTKILKQCWMFTSHTDENIEIIVDAMEEKIVPPNVKLVCAGDNGDVMWIIEEGILECLKNINGEEQVVKTCTTGDLFGELALLYNCPRAASVVSKEKCTLWELDRDTFKAICYEAAQQTRVSYEGFTAPGAAPCKEVEVEEAAGEADADGEQDEDMVEELVPQKKGRRREGVSAEALAGGDSDWTPPVFAKSAEERQQLSDIIRTSRDTKLHMLFGLVSKDTFEKILDAMQIKQFGQGEHAIEQGAVGDYFYIVKGGDFDIYVQKGEDPPKKVFQAGVGFAFGELALLYNAPRSATITAQGEAEVWSLDRTAFRNLVVRSSEAQFKMNVEFLNGVDVFQVLNGNERASLAEVLEEEEFQDDEAIVEQGEKDDKMFILRSGKAVACIKGEQGEVEVMQYGKGAYFGEIALLSGEPRKASVYAVGPCTCLYISRPTFLRVLGPLQSLLERNMGKYEKYQDAIKSATTEDEGDVIAEVHDEEEATGTADLGGATKDKKTKVARKRERPAENMEKLEHGKNIDKDKDDTPAESLADKVAQDFKNPKLVNPTAEFAIQQSVMMMYGGLIPGQKFTMDKIIHVQSEIPAKMAGDQELWNWKAESKIKGITEISVMCQKGQKSASDPTPNQDNFFVHKIGAVSMYGVTDGHGPFGHLVSFRLVQTLPYYICKNEWFGKDWALCLKEAFLSAQKDLVDFCGEQNINIEASGAAGSVMLQEEQTVHIAFIGDARIMLGSWNRRDTRMIFCTQDHKPNLPAEKARLEEAGSEVREIDPGNHRIYIKGTNFPGLTMSRAFGDTACAGVLREPEYHKHLMQPSDQWYAIVASDGVWEFLEGQEVCDMTAKKLRLKGPRETLSFLVNASRKRWNYCCGDYCDDITAILIQWNAPAEAITDGASANHQLSVKRPEK